MYRLAVLLCLFSTSTLAIDNGQYKDIDPKIKSWFESVKSPYGMPCCSISDGHLTTWKKMPNDDRYWVPIDGLWHPVPAETVVRNSGNPFDTAVVWYTKQGESYYIRCFVPANEA